MNTYHREEPPHGASQEGAWEVQIKFFFFDASAIVKLIIDEPGSALANQIRGGTGNSIHTSGLCIAESLRVLKRKFESPKDSVNQRDYEFYKYLLNAHVRDRLHLVDEVRLQERSDRFEAYETLAGHLSRYKEDFSGRDKRFRDPEYCGYVSEHLLSTLKVLHYKHKEGGGAGDYVSDVVDMCRKHEDIDAIDALQLVAIKRGFLRIFAADSSARLVSADRELLRAARAETIPTIDVGRDETRTAERG